MKLSRKLALGAFASATIISLSASAFAEESAQTAAGFLRMEIMTNCKNGNAFFRVRNAGEAWPKSSTFAIYHVGKNGRKLIAKRRMRLKDGQRASFRIKAGRFPSGQIGLWIKPGWYEREFGYDATISCS
ncbi:MAG: hypothetical protein ACE5GT_11300 [Rhodospirillales bacterium]